MDLNRIACNANEYDPKTKILKVFGQTGGRVYLYDTYYGLLDENRESYEKIEVIGNETPQSVKLRNPLEKELASNSPVFRVVFGSVKENGDYCIRVRDNAKDIIYLLRYKVNGEVKFKKVDFREGVELS